MDKYLSMVMDYINRSRTNYALMISGGWGNGKTHFINTVVFPKLISEEKKPIYISLNGVNTVEEISKQIYFATSFLSDERLKSVRESKPAKYLTQVVKVAHSAASILNFAGSDTGTTINYEELIDLGNNIILCFDDLERCQINTIELLGYINKFVEHDEIKTIIIGNEKEIKDLNSEQNKELKMLTAIQALGNEKEIKNEDIDKKLKSLYTEQKTYDVIKEKVIGKTIIYVPESTTIINEIIKEYNETSTENYYSFLEESKDDILYLFNKSDRKNIRVLKHSLSDFAKVYLTLDTNLENPTYKKQLLIKYFIPSLIFGIEYRSGAISLDDTNYRNSTRLTASSFVSFSEEYTSFYSKYLNGFPEIEEFYISKPIITYITSSILNEDELQEEANNIIHEWVERETKRDIPKSSLDKLTDNFLELENEEFNECVQDVITKVNEGSYPLEYLNRVFYQLELFYNNKLLTKDIEEIKNSFTEGINNSIQNDKAFDRFQMFFIENKSENQLEIENLIQQRYIALQSEHLKGNLEELINLLPENINDFTKEYYQLAKGKDAYMAIMPFIDIPNFSLKLTELTNSGLASIRELYNSIYSFSNIDHYYKDDYKPMIELITLIREHQKDETGVRLISFKLLADSLNEKAKILNRNVQFE